MIQIKQYLKIAKLIAGNIMKSGNEANSKALEQWLNESDENSTIYQNINGGGWYHENKVAIEQFNVEKGWYKVQSRITSNPRTIKLIPKSYKFAAAAILIIALTSTYFLRDTIFNKHIENTTPIIVNNTIKPGIDKATLTLEDDSTIILEKGSTYQAKNVDSNGEQIIYQPTTGSRQLLTNTLTIPRGGQFQLTLSDGTQVWLNSETQLKYPVSFIDGETRQVEIVYGEAYFDVSPSTVHKGSKFKVYNNAQEVEVLGTKFNIKAYKDDPTIYTTLVEGKVDVKTATQSKILKPNQQSTVNVSNKSIEVANINVLDEVAWVNGEFIIRGKNLKEIMEVLSRWYDMDVTFANKELENVRFVGVLGKDQNIVDILNTIKRFGVINDYEINNKKVILK